MLWSIAGLAYISVMWCTSVIINGFLSRAVLLILWGVVFSGTATSWCHYRPWSDMHSPWLQYNKKISAKWQYGSLFMLVFPLHFSGTMRMQGEGESKQRPEGLCVKVKYISVRLIQHLFQSVMTPAIGLSRPYYWFLKPEHVDIAEEAGVAGRQHPSDIPSVHN